MEAIEIKVPRAFIEMPAGVPYDEFYVLLRERGHKIRIGPKTLKEAEDEIDSRTAYNHLKESGTPMSRASVISFLNRMVKEGFLEYREVTDKGGHKKLYRLSPEASDEGSFRRIIAERSIRKVLEEMAANPRRGW